MHIRRNVMALIVAPPLGLIAAAYAQWAMFGLPDVAPAAHAAIAPAGFPAWLRLAHYINFLFLTLLVRSGLQILMDHPRLYSNVHCTPGTEWLRLTPITLPIDRVWTSKDDSRYLSPWIGLPGRRHTVGMARHWHFLSVLFWVGNGVVFVTLLFTTGYWRRLVPASWDVLPQAWAVFVHYATGHPPPEPNAFVQYNALQQLAYFSVVFILAPVAIVTGPSMSPALTNRFSWYPRVPGNRQIGRSLHFLVMVAFVGFVIVHVALITATGLVRNMNHIVLGVDDARVVGLLLGLFGIAAVAAACGLAYWAAWRHPRAVQHTSKVIVGPIMGSLLDRPAPPRAVFRREDVSPYFWVNGNQPMCDEWTRLAANAFRDYRLRVHGLVEHPVDLSLDQLVALGYRSQVTLHHCIQGWSGIAEWGGVPLAVVLDLVRPRSEASAVVVYSFSDGVDFATGLPGGQYYDSLSIRDARNPLTMLAHQMNGVPLPLRHGAPLRLRVENQLGFKMVKWIRSIELVEDVRAIHQGEGGYAEDNEFFGELASI